LFSPMTGENKDAGGDLGLGYGLQAVGYLVISTIVERCGRATTQQEGKRNGGHHRPVPSGIGAAQNEVSPGDWRPPVRHHVIKSGNGG